MRTEIKTRKDVNGKTFYELYKDGRYIKSEIKMEELN